MWGFGNSTDSHREWSCLLAGDVTAEETGLDPVDGDKNTVAG